MFRFRKGDNDFTRRLPLKTANRLSRNSGIPKAVENLLGGNLFPDLKIGCTWSIRSDI